MQIPTGLLRPLGAKAPACIRTDFNRHQFCFRHIRGTLWAGVADFLSADPWQWHLSPPSSSAAIGSPKTVCFCNRNASGCGMTGAVFAGYPLHQATILFGWRNVTRHPHLALLMAVMVFMFVRDDPSGKGLKSYLDKESSRQKEDKILRSLGRVFRFSNTWFLSIAPGGIVGAVLTFSGLWESLFSPRSIISKCNCRNPMFVGDEVAWAPAVRFTAWFQKESNCVGCLT